MRNSNAVIIDTGYFIALFCKRDRYHKKALALRPVIEKRPWVTTLSVMTEVCHLLQKFAPHAQIPFLALFRDGLIGIFDLKESHFPRLLALFEKYQDLPIDLADASLVILAEDFSCRDIVSTDERDFQTYRWKNTKPFRNLMSE